MKAILKSNRKTIVDINLDWIKVAYDSQGNVCRYYRDINGVVYREDELDWVEYYGG